MRLDFSLGSGFLCINNTRANGFAQFSCKGGKIGFPTIPWSFPINNLCKWLFCLFTFPRRHLLLLLLWLRAVYKDTKSSYHQLLIRANLPTLLNRRLQDICVLMYKVKHTKMCSEAITNIFKPRDSCYSLRNSDFLLPRFNTVSFGKHSLRYLGPILWSKLDKNDKTCKSLSDFRNRMRNKDLTSLIDDGCKGCLLCDSWCLIGNNFSILVLSFSILANNL